MDIAISEVPRQQPRAGHRRRGRRAQAAGTTPVAQELRRRREALDLTVRQAAERAHVTAAMISEIERGVRVPSVATWTKLRQGLGIEAPLAILTRSQPPTEVLDVHLTRLAACLIGSGGRARLPDLGQALGVPAAAVREQLPGAAARLAACGFELVTDGLEVRLQPLEVCAAPLEELGAVQQERRRRVLSEEAVIVLTYIGWHGEATRREIERFRGEESETLLGRLLDADLVASVRDESQQGHPNRYRLTVGGLRTLGAASPEELREKLRPSVGALVAAEPNAEAVPLEEQLQVLTLVAGFEEADVELIGRALRRPTAACASLLERLVSTGVLRVVPALAGPRYRLGASGVELLGARGAAAVRRAAERASADRAAARMRAGDDSSARTPGER